MTIETLAVLGVAGVLIGFWMLLLAFLRLGRAFRRILDVYQAERVMKEAVDKWEAKSK